MGSSGAQGAGRARPSSIFASLPSWAQPGQHCPAEHQSCSRKGVLAGVSSQSRGAVSTCRGASGKAALGVAPLSGKGGVRHGVSSGFPNWAHFLEVCPLPV